MNETKPADAKEAKAAPKGSHDEQTSDTANQIRAAIKDVRGGMSQFYTDELLKKLEAVANNLDEQGKSDADVKRLREERGETEPEPVKSEAERLQATVQEAEKEKKEIREREKRDREQAQKKTAAATNISSPASGEPDRRLGIPPVTSQPTVERREHVEAIAKKADDDLKKK